MHIKLSFLKKLIFVFVATGFFIETSIVFAATTIGTNISTGGTLTADGAIKFTSGATNKYILTTDASGNATWVSVSSALSNASLGVGSASGIAPLDSSSQVPLSNLPVGVAGGIATLDGTGKVTVSQLPSIAITDVFVSTSSANMLALTAQVGDVDIRSDVNKTYILSASPASTLSNWLEIITPLDTALKISNNLSDLSDTSIARTNIGLGNVANVDTTNAGNIATGTLSNSRLSTTVTLQGNTFNGVNQLVKLDGSGNLPALNGTALTGLVLTSIGTTKGDIIAFSASNTPVRLGVGLNGQILVASSTSSTGLEWTFASTTGATVAWGSITGTLSSQTDLQNALDAKLSTTSAAATYVPYSYASSTFAAGTGAINKLAIWTGTNTLTSLATGTAGTFLRASSTSATGFDWASSVLTETDPIWTAASTSYLTIASATSTYVSYSYASSTFAAGTGAINKLAIWTGTNTVTSFATGTAGQFLRASSTSPTGLDWAFSSSTGAVWGSLTGLLSDQTDLQNALDAKLSTTSAAATYLTIASATSTYVPYSYASSTFQTILTNPVTGTGATNTISYWTSAGTIGTITTGSAGSFLRASSTSATGFDWSFATGSGSIAWGSITGILSDQTDLQNALNAKLSTTTASTTYAKLDSPIFTGTVHLPGAGSTFIGSSGAKSISLTSSGAISTTNSGSGNQLLGVDSANTNPEYKTLSGLNNITVTHGVGTVKLDLSGGTTGNLAYWASSTALGNIATGTAGQFLRASTTSATGFDWITGGTVSYFDISGDTTGLTFTGGPVTSSSTIIAGGTLNVSHGGTGATSGGSARTNLGVGIGDSPTFAGMTLSSTTLGISSGGTNSSSTPTAGAIAYGTGTGYAFTAVGTAGQGLQSNGSSAPTWADIGTMMFSGNSNNTIVNNTTQYFPIIGIVAGNGTDSSAGTRTLISRSGTIKNLRVLLSAAIGAGKTGSVTVMKNGVATAVVTTLDTTSTAYSDTSNSFTVVAGDEVGIKVTVTSNTSKFSWATDFTN